MMKLLAFLWAGCWHKWTILREVELYETPQSKLPAGRKYHLQCEHCGTVWSKEV